MNFRRYAALNLNPNNERGLTMAILIVDDNELVLALLCDYLRADYDVLCVATSDKALELAEKEDLQLAFIDVTLPKINGIELSQRLHSINPALPIVLMSGYGDLEQSAMSLTHVAAFLKKPFNLDEFEQITEKLLKIRG
jgi:DNA-binding NtrC family response regulator